MNILELRKKKIKDLQKILIKKTNKYFKLNLQAKHRQLKKIHLLKFTRKKIAQIKTIITEKKKQKNEKKNKRKGIK